MNKNRLKAGDIITFRGNYKGKLLDGGFIGDIINTTSTRYISSLTEMREDLLFHNRTMTQFDITEVDRDGRKIFKRISQEVEQEEMVPDKALEKYCAEYFPKYYGEIEKVIFNGPCTVVQLKDGRKGVVHLTDGDEHDYKEGVYLAFIKALRSKKESADNMGIMCFEDEG